MLMTLLPCSGARRPRENGLTAASPGRAEQKARAGGEDPPPPPCESTRPPATKEAPAPRRSEPASDQPVVVETRRCASCGTPFAVTAADMAELAAVWRRLGWVRVDSPARCKTCRAEMQRHEAAWTPSPQPVHRLCSCGARFEIGPRQQVWYHDHELRLPRRCSDCRRAARENRLRDELVNDRGA